MDIADLRTPWIDSPFFEALLARRDFDPETRELVRTYARDGFLTFDPQIPDFDAVADRVIEALSRRADYPTRVMDAWSEIDGIKALALAPRVLSLLRTLYGREPIPMQTLNFGRGTQQRVHRTRCTSVPCRTGSCAASGLRSRTWAKTTVRSSTSPAARSSRSWTCRRSA